MGIRFNHRTGAIETGGNLVAGNYEFDTDQTVGAGQDNYVLTYDNATGLISLEVVPAGGGGLTASDSPTITGVWTFSNKTHFTYAATAGARNSSLVVYNGNPQISIEDTGALTDEGVWNIIGGTGDLKIRALSDDYGTSADAMAITRGTGAAVDSISFFRPIISDMGGGQVMIIQDDVVGGNAYNAWIQWKDSGGVDQGYIGFGSVSNETFYINNQAGGNILLNSALGTVSSGPITAQGTVSDNGEVGQVAFMDIASGYARFGSYNFDTAAYQPVRVVGSDIILTNTAGNYVEVVSDTAVSGIHVRYSSTLQAGYFYGDANGIGILHDGGGWALQVADTTHEIMMHGDVDMQSGTTLTVADGALIQQMDYSNAGLEYFNVHWGSVTSGTWYTIATDPSTLDITTTPVGKTGASRASARIKIWDNTSGQHGYIEFEVSCMYGRRPRVTILNSSSYGGDYNVINMIRIVRYTTYTGVAIQVRAGHTGTLYAALHKQHTGGFHLVDWSAQTPHATWNLDLIDFGDYAAAPAWGSFLGPVDSQTGTTDMRGACTVYGSTLNDYRFYPAGPTGGYLTHNDANDYGTLQLYGTQTSYAGIAMNAGAHVLTMMSNGTTCGFYNDTDNQWLLNGVANSAATLYNNGTGVIQTTSTGGRHPSYGAYYHNASSSYLGGKVTFSTSAATGGSSGDIWYQYT